MAEKKPSRASKIQAALALEKTRENELDNGSDTEYYCSDNDQDMDTIHEYPIVDDVCETSISESKKRKVDETESTEVIIRFSPKHGHPPITFTNSLSNSTDLVQSIECDDRDIQRGLEYASDLPSCTVIDVSSRHSKRKKCIMVIFDLTPSGNKSPEARVFFSCDRAPKSNNKISAKDFVKIFERLELSKQQYTSERTLARNLIGALHSAAYDNSSEDINIKIAHAKGFLYALSDNLCLFDRILFASFGRDADIPYTRFDIERVFLIRI